MMMIVHNIEFNNYSPGKLLIYKFFEKFFNDDNNITKIEKIFDFGRGNEDYKYVFANNDAIMLNINTNNILAKISRTLYKIIKLL